MPSINTSSDGEILTIYLNEPRILDELVIKQIREEIVALLSKTEERCVLMDFRQVKFLSSAALGALLRIHKKCKEFKVELKFSNIAPDIYKVFEITGLNKVFSIHKDADDAIEAFKKSGMFFR